MARIVARIVARIAIGLQPEAVAVRVTVDPTGAGDPDHRDGRAGAGAVVVGRLSAHDWLLLLCPVAAVAPGFYELWPHEASPVGESSLSAALALASAPCV